MSLNTALYLVNIIDNVNQGISIIFVLGIICLIACLIAYGLWSIDQDEDCYPVNIVKILKKWWVLIVILIATIPIPSKSTMYLMLGSIYLEQSNLPRKVTQALELKLNDYIKEFQEEGKDDNK